MSGAGCHGCGAGHEQVAGPDNGKYFSTGLWENNIALVQMLGMCPTMAVTTTATNGLGMGLATTAVMVLSNLAISLMRNAISPEIRNPVMIAVIAGMVTLVDMAMNAWVHELYKVLGLFIALIVTNCAVLGRTEAFALKHPPLPSILDGLGMGLGFTLALTVLGSVREILGSGTLFSQASSLLGSHFQWMELTLMSPDKGILLAILPPGGFMALGLLIVAKRLIDQSMQRRKAEVSAPLVSLQS